MILLRHRYWQIETYRRQAQTEAQGEKSLRTFLYRLFKRSQLVFQE